MTRIYEGPRERTMRLALNNLGRAMGIVSHEQDDINPRARLITFK